LEEVNASYKDLAEVCGRIRGKKAGWAVSFLEKAAKGEVPVLYRKRAKRLGHRRALGGKKGRYPKKAAKIVLKVLRSAMANGRTIGLGESYTILAVSANKKHVYPRLQAKGRMSRANLETSRIEVVLQGPEVPKGVKVTPPKKEIKKEEKKPEVKEEEKREEPKLLKREGKTHHEHKHDMEKAHEQEKKRKEMPHQHGEHDKR